MEVTNLAIQDTMVVHLDHPATGEKLYDVDEKGVEDKSKPVTVTIASLGSKEYRTAANASKNRALVRSRTGKHTTAQIEHAEGIEILTKICVSSTYLTHKGKDVQSEQDFRTLLADEKMYWIKQQIDTALGDAGNFIKP